MLEVYNDEYFMKEALKEASAAFEKGEVPVGAVIVLEKKIIARAHNLTEQLNDVTAHAEIQAITSASEFLSAKYLKKCTLYVSLEPCCMCAGALYWSQIDRIVYAASDEKRGASTHTKSLYHPKTKVEKSLLENEASELMKAFFKSKRD